MTSDRLVLGARYTRDYGKSGKGYVGLAYQYEFGGDARAHWNGYDLPSPSVEGSTVRLETGWNYTPSENSPLALDLGITGSTGKERGVGFRVGVNTRSERTFKPPRSGRLSLCAVRTKNTIEG